MQNGTRSANDPTLALVVLTSTLHAFGPLGWLPASWCHSGVPAGRMRVAIVADDACAEVDASVRDDLRRHDSHMDDAEYAAAQQQAAGHSPHSREFPAWHWRGLTISRRDWVHHDEVRGRVSCRRRWHWSPEPLRQPRAARANLSVAEGSSPNWRL